MAKKIITAWYQATQAVAAGGNIVTFSSPNIDSDRVVSFLVDCNPAGAAAPNPISGITRVRVKAGSDTIWDFTIAQLRALIQRFSRSNFPLLTTATRFQIPFYHLDKHGDARYDAHFPIGKKATVEITFGAAAVAGTCQMGAVLVNEYGPEYTKYLGQFLNWAVGPVTNQGFTVTQKGILRGITVPTTGLGRLQMKLGGEMRFDGSAAIFLESDQMQNIGTLVDPNTLKIHGPVRMIDGDYILGDTLAAWVATNEAGFYLTEVQGS